MIPDIDSYFLNFLCNLNVIIEGKEETLNTRKKTSKPNSPSKKMTCYSETKFIGAVWIKSQNQLAKYARGVGDLKALDLATLG